MLAQTKTLTIIVPAYNVGRYISDALDSIAAQEPAFDEIIIINDGSTDSTLQIIQQHPCSATANVITTENRGLGPTRNLGIEHASGDYIYFFDSDDVLDHAFTKTIHACIGARNTPDLILFSGRQFCDDSGFKGSQKGFFRGCELHDIGSEEAITTLMPAGSLYPHAVLYVSKRRLWGQAGLWFKPILHEDEEVKFPLLLSANKISVLDDVLYHRRIRPGSITSSAKTGAHCNGLLATAMSMSKLYQQDTMGTQRVRKVIRRKAIRHAKRYMRTCHKASEPVKYRTITVCACMLRSPDILFSAIGAYLKALILGSRRTL